MTSQRTSFVGCAAGKVEDLGTGEYRARFTATAAGSYSVAVRLGGQNVSGSPFCAEVAAAAIAADCSYVVQEGLEHGVSGSQVRQRSCPPSRLASEADVPATIPVMQHGKTDPLMHVTRATENLSSG